MTPPSLEKLAQMLAAVEEHLRPEELAIVIVMTPKEHGGVTLSFNMDCSDEIAKETFTSLARGFDAKTPIAEESAH